MLKRLGNFYDARVLFGELLSDASKKSNSYKRREARWIQQAREEFFFAISDGMTSEELSATRK
jgi:hypothetical protein